MKVKQYIGKYGWDVFCDIPKDVKYQTVDIGFMNSANTEDETEFEINAYDVNELSSLFRNFCTENRFSENRVLYVRIVRMGNVPEEDEHITVTHIPKSCAI